MNKLIKNHKNICKLIKSAESSNIARQYSNPEFERCLNSSTITDALNVLKEQNPGDENKVKRGEILINTLEYIINNAERMNGMHHYTFLTKLLLEQPDDANVDNLTDGSYMHKWFGSDKFKNNFDYKNMTEKRKHSSLRFTTNMLMLLKKLPIVANQCGIQLNEKMQSYCDYANTIK